MPEATWWLLRGQWVAGCPACGSATQQGWVLVGGSRWVALAESPGGIDGDALFAARVDQGTHVLWVCQSCGEAVS